MKRDKINIFFFFSRKKNTFTPCDDVTEYHWYNFELNLLLSCSSYVTHHYNVIISFAPSSFPVETDILYII